MRLLGGFELRVADATVEVKPGPQRLLALLALTGAPLDRTFAACQLWPEATRERAQANLRSTLWRLHDVPATLITASKTHLGLAAAVWVDVRQGLAELQRVDPDATADALHCEATLLADLLPDWYDDWLETERERIRQLRLAALERCAEGALATGRPAEGIQLGLRAAALEPLRESPHRVVIRCHLAEGNVVEAVRQYQRFAALLHRELNAAPSALMTRLLAALPPTAPRRPMPAARPSPVGDFPRPGAERRPAAEPRRTTVSAR